jgi:glycosyltransferase involved in cell wall biosynthesis
LAGPDYGALAGFITTAASAATGAGRASHALRNALAARSDVIEAVINRESGWLEVGRKGGDYARKAKGFRKAGKSYFAYSLRKSIPPFRKSFLDTQNLACLRVPRAGIFVFDVFYLTHPDSWSDRVLARTLYRGMKDYPFILTCSEYTRSVLEERMGIPRERVTAVPLSYKTDVFRPLAFDGAEKAGWLAARGIPFDRRILSHVSSGDKRKNLGGILRALRMVLERHPEAVLIKAGKILHGKNHEALLASIDRMGLKDKVFFIEGLATDEDLAKLYNLSDAFVFPSLAEGFGLPVLEAQACGCPVVTANTTSLAEIAGPLCRAVDPFDDIAIADAISAQLADTGLRARSAAPSAAYLKRFTWEPSCRAVDEWLR